MCRLTCWASLPEACDGLSSSRSSVEAPLAHGKLVRTVGICEQTELSCASRDRSSSYELIMTRTDLSLSLTEKSITRRAEDGYKAEMKHEKAVGHPQAEAERTLSTPDNLFRAFVLNIPGLVGHQFQGRHVSEPFPNNSTTQLQLENSASFGSGQTVTCQLPSQKSRLYTPPFWGPWQLVSQ